MRISLSTTSFFAREGRRGVFAARFLSIFVICAVAVFSLFQGATGEDGESRRYSFTERREIVWDEGKPLVVRESEGTIYVRGWKKKELKVKAVKTSHAPQLSLARRNASTLQVVIESPQEMISIRTMNPALKTGGIRSYIDYSLFVPHGIDMELRTVEGALYAINLDGDVDARTASGTVTLRNASGPVRVYTDSGNIFITECPGLNTAVSISGDIEIKFKDSKPDADAELSTGAGNISIEFLENTPLILDVTAKPGTVDSSEAVITVSAEAETEEEGESGTLEMRKYYSGGGGPFIRISAASGTVTIKTTTPPEKGRRPRRFN